MICPYCDAEMNWTPCSQCEGDGGYWAEEGTEWVPCSACAGEEGAWRCPDHPKGYRLIDEIDRQAVADLDSHDPTTDVW